MTTNSGLFSLQTISGNVNQENLVQLNLHFMPVNSKFSKCNYRGYTELSIGKGFLESKDFHTFVIRFVESLSCIFQVRDFGYPQNAQGITFLVLTPKKPQGHHVVFAIAFARKFEM